MNMVSSMSVIYSTPTNTMSGRAVVIRISSGMWTLRYHLLSSLRSLQSCITVQVLLDRLCQYFEGTVMSSNIQCISLAVVPQEKMVDGRQPVAKGGSELGSVFNLQCLKLSGVGRM